MSFRTMIVPFGTLTTFAQDLCAGLAGPSGAGMFETELSSNGLDPATHTISSGPFGDNFAALLPLTSFDDDLNTVTTPGHPELIVALCAEKGIAVTLEQITDLLDSIDVSEQEPFVAQARLGLEMVRRPLP